MNKRVAIGDMLYLTSDREGIVRFKGKTGFGLGEWYGIEIRTPHKTRHDGLIHGKRYFRCPRNKGLFIRRQIINAIMDKKTAEQKTRVFKYGGKHRKILRKYKNQPQQSKKKANKKQKKVNKSNNKLKKTQKNSIKPKQPNIDEKEDEKQDEEKEKEAKQMNIKIDKIAKEEKEEKKQEKEEETKDFSSKESFSNPKSRKYFGADQVFTGLDRRRSKYEDILLIDPNSSIVHQQNDQRHKNSKLGTKRRKSKKFKVKNTQKRVQNKPAILTDIKEENDKKIDESPAVSNLNINQSIPSETNNFPDTKQETLNVNATENKFKFAKNLTSNSPSLSPLYSPFMPDSPAASPSQKNSIKKYRPFGGDTSPKAQLSAPVHIKQISMEFIKGNFKARLKKVVTTKRKKRNGSIRNVYEKYATKADYPKLDDLRNETLVSEFLSFELYNIYRDEANIVNDYSIDRAIECGCFYLPDPIGFRLADFKTYEVFQDICDELLSVLHDEWNPKDRPHKKNTDWRLLLTMNTGVNMSMSMNVMSKRSKSPNPYGYRTKSKRRSRGLSLATNSAGASLREKRKKSKRRKNTSGTHNIGVSVDIIGISEETEINMISESVSADERKQEEEGGTDGEEKDMLREKEKHERKRRKREDKRRKSHKRQRLKESSMNSSFMMARLQLWDNDYVSSCRITLSRNLHGFRFSNVISRSERINLEKMLSSVLSQCNEGALKGRYRPYHKINASKLPLLIETDKLFPKPDAPGLIMAGYARDWPQSRGIFINNNKNLYIWCNYLEHLHLISVQNDGNILQAFKRLFDCEEKLESSIKQRQQIFLDNLFAKQQDILSRELQFNSNANANVAINSNISIESPTNMNNEQMLVSETPDSPTSNSFTFSEVVTKVKKQGKKEKKGLRLTKQEYRIKKMNFSTLYSEIGFVYDDELGYISSNPQYFGTSMRVYVTVKLPNLICHEKFNDILEIRNLTAYQHDVDSAQQMFMAYASQLPSVKEVRQRRNSTTNPSTKTNKNPSQTLPKLAKIKNSQTTPLMKHGTRIDDMSASDSNDDIAISVDESHETIKKKNRNVNVKRDPLKLNSKSKMKEDLKEDDFMSNLNLPAISNKSSESDNDEINEPKVPLATLTTSIINKMNKFASVPIDDAMEKEKEKEKEKGLIDDEDLGDVVNPSHYKEEITIYQTTSLGISEVDQVKNMVEAIKCLIEMEKLLSAGNKLDERIKAEKLKKSQSKFKK